MLKAIFATDMAGGFGYEGRLPWPKIKEDLAFFKEKTCNGIIIMGRKTHESLPTLPYRTPFVITSDPEYTVMGGSIFTPDILNHLKEFEESNMVGCDVSIIGGATLLSVDVLKQCDEIYHTTVKGTFPVDVKIDDEVLAYLKTREEEILLETEKCIIRRYSAELP